MTSCEACRHVLTGATRLYCQRKGNTSPDVAAYERQSGDCGVEAKHFEYKNPCRLCVFGDRQKCTHPDTDYVFSGGARGDSDDCGPKGRYFVERPKPAQNVVEAVSGLAEL